MNQRNRVNVYTCIDHKHQTVTVDRDDGVTPFITMCPHPGCESRAESEFYRVNQAAVPTHEWYKPGLAEFSRLSPGSKDHVARGGLLLRKIEPIDRSGDPPPADGKYPYQSDVPDWSRYYNKIPGTRGTYVPPMSKRQGFKQRPKN